MDSLERKRQRPVMTLELVVKTRSGHWEGRGHFSSNERSDAIAEAKRLEKDPDVLSVKVTKEVYDPNDHSTQETTIYRSKGVFVEDVESVFEARRKRLQELEARKRACGEHGLGGALRRLLGAVSGLLGSASKPGPRAKHGARAEGAQDTAAPPEGSRKAKPRDAGAGQRGRGDETPAAGSEAAPWHGHRDQVLAFLGDSEELIEGLNRRNDNFNRFGVCFFICGVCEAVYKQQPLPPEAALEFVADSLSLLRLPRERARRFAARCEGYLIENGRYMEIFQVGHNAMVAHRRDGVRSSTSLRTALKAWSERRNDPTTDGRRSVTLMFTDIVDSSALASEHGDAHAMKVLRVHNHIVETVLREYGGLYVKNTGDGILAAFDEATMAVKASAIIQRCVKEHNASFPRLPLSLRIGLNVGDAIAESGDFFGSAVNLASRVCAAAGPGEILCTGIVHRRAAATALPFHARGAHRLKGFREPVPLFDVLWDSGSQATARRAAETKTGSTETAVAERFVDG